SGGRGHVSGLHDNGHDHRPSFGALVDEPAGGAAHFALQRIDVAHACGKRRLDRVRHGVARLVEQVLGFRCVHPPPGDDLRAHQHLARPDVDGDDDHDHTLFGEHLAVAQHALADVADDPVYVEVTGRDAPACAAAVSVE